MTSEEIVALTVALVGAAYAAEQRWHTWTLWKLNRGTYFYQGHTPSLIDTDGGYYACAALGRYQVGALDGLSWVLRVLTGSTEDQRTVLIRGNLMLVWTAALSVLGIAGSFWLLGYPMAGAVAGIGTVGCSCYYARSTIGRIDTDQLNVAFLVGVLALISAFSSSTGEMDSFLLFAAVCVAAVAFDLWWPKSVLLLTFALMMSLGGWLVWGLEGLPVGLAFLGITGWRHASHWFTFAEAVWTNYVRRSHETGVHDTVGELSRPGFFFSLRETIGEPALVVPAVAGLGWIFATDPAMWPFALLPAMYVGALLRGQRWLPYAAPAFWFGLGFVAVQLGGAAAAIPTAAFAFVSGRGQRNGLYRPKMDHGLTALLEQTGKAGISGKILTWWDYGHWIRLWSRFDPVADPGAPWAEEVRVIAEVLTETDLDEAATLCEELGAQYIMVTRDMMGWWPAITKVAGIQVKFEDSVVAQLATGNDPQVGRFKAVAFADPVARIYEVTE